MINLNYRTAHIGRNAGRAAASLRRPALDAATSGRLTALACPSIFMIMLCKLTRTLRAICLSEAAMIAIRLTGKPCDFAPAAGEISYR
jgi:hypothetical protein